MLVDEGWVSFRDVRPGVLVGDGWVRLGKDARRVESKRVDEFANMSDEELRRYVYGTKELDG